MNDVNRQNTEALSEYAGSSALKADYTYGNGRLSTSNAAAEGVLGQTAPASYISNGQNSVQTLLGDAGTALASYSYGPFGETTASALGQKSGTALQASFYGYNGENFDSLSNLQYLRARYYDPASGRFTAADTTPGTLLDPLTQNAYSYAGNDPVNFSDPSGHSWLSNIGNAIVSGAKAVAGAVVTAAKTVATAVVSAARTVANAVVSTVRTVANAVASGARTVYNAVTGGAQYVYNNYIQPGAQWVNNNVVQPAVSNLAYLATVATNSATNMAQYLQAGGTYLKDMAQTYTQMLVSKANEFICTTSNRISNSDTTTGSLMLTSTPTATANMNTQTGASGSGVQVGLFDYAATYPGSVVTYDDKTGKYTVSWNGMTLSGYATMDKGRVFVSDSEFINAFGTGDDKLSVFRDGMNRNISIRANFNITNNTNSTIDGSTYTDAFLSGVAKNWSGKIGQYNLATYTGESNNGIGVNIGNVDTNAENDNSYALIPGDRSSSNPGSITMRTGDSRSGVVYSDEQFMWTSAHEFIHTLGVDDSYNSQYVKDNPEFKSITNQFGTPVQDVDVTKVLAANNTNTWQTWP